MITGDHPATAVAIARQLGIAPPAARDEEVLSFTGPQLDRMSDAQMDAAVVKCGIFARASPENKIKIVKALQRVGETCSMTGDGVNDAPALKAANIGVAMGITGVCHFHAPAAVLSCTYTRRWSGRRQSSLFFAPTSYRSRLGTCIQRPTILERFFSPPRSPTHPLQCRDPL
jgi:hypothetical protein